MLFFLFPLGNNFLKLILLCLQRVIFKLVIIKCLPFMEYVYVRLLPVVYKHCCILIDKMPVRWALIFPLLTDEETEAQRD